MDARHSIQPRPCACRLTWIPAARQHLRIPPSSARSVARTSRTPMPVQQVSAPWRSEFRCILQKVVMPESAGNARSAASTSPSYNRLSLSPMAPLPVQGKRAKRQSALQRSNFSALPNRTSFFRYKTTQNVFESREDESPFRVRRRDDNQQKHQRKTQKLTFRQYISFFIVTNPMIVAFMHQLLSCESRCPPSKHRFIPFNLKPNVNLVSFSQYL